MKVCTNCNRQFDDEMVFCPYCGGQLVANDGTSYSAFEGMGETLTVNDAETAYEEGLRFYFGKEVRQNFTEAAKWFRKAAEQGHAKAQFNLGLMYGKGEGVGRNDAETVKWFQRAAEQGHPEAQVGLAAFYIDGKGVEKNYTEAAKWYRMAADQGNAEAQDHLGWLYEHGQGVSKDYAEALKWYRKAAEKGHAEAQNNLAYLYQNGIGVVQDYVEASRWYYKAAVQGYSYAQNNLGKLYEKGLGVELNFAEAVKWFQKAAEQGFADAQCKLGIHLYYGSPGVMKDETAGLMWLRKAAAQRNTGAMFTLHTIEKEEEKKKKGCFITTAVCGSLGKPDDCDELMTMRRYRDELKAEDKDMALLIDEYYRVAPLLVEKIDKSKESKRIYTELWKSSISMIYENIKQGDTRKAKLQYIDMLEKLCVDYNVALAPSIATSIKKVRNQQH